MDILNVFRNDAFSTVSLTSWVDRIPYVPVGIGDMNIFEDVPLRTTAMAVEERDGLLVLIPTTPRGAPRTERVTEKRKMRYFEVPRLFHGDTILSSEIQNVREFIGTGGVAQTVLMQLVTEVQRRLAGPTGILTNLDYTEEYHRLAAIQGLLLDVDGSVIHNWFSEFELTQPAEIGFNLAAGATAPTGTIRPLCNQIARAMRRAAQGTWRPTTRVVGLCGDEFFDAFVNHADVRSTYLNFMDAREIRTGTAFNAFEQFQFGNITWINYRGSDDNSTVAIPIDKVKFFPVGAPGVFQKGMAPGESFEWVNQPGKPRYVRIIPDEKRNEKVEIEATAYPLHICTRPDMLQSGRYEA
ncbi:major capsid protein [Rhodopila sp.]|uniref:major capsid protein n=1 Tax=Rhodopila sp. TaxID=2480087 RepID=UPI003D1038CE